MDKWMLSGRGFEQTTIAITMAAGLALACSDSQGPGDHTPQPLPPSPFVVSSPVPRPPSAISSPSSTTSAAAGASTAVYVSLRPSAIPDGWAATFDDPGSVSGVAVRLVDGGFDPVAVPAAVGDTLAVTVLKAGGGSVPYQVIVKPDAALIVVRTKPLRHKRDVPLNVRIMVVFSQPVDPATLAAGIQLWRGATLVGGKAQFADADGTSIEFQPDSLLAENADYKLLVTSAIRDMNGLPLQSTTEVPFTTVAAAAPLSRFPVVFDAELLRGTTAFSGTLRETDSICRYWWMGPQFDVAEPCHAYRLRVANTGLLRAQLTWEETGWMSLSQADMPSLPTSEDPLSFERSVQEGDLIVVTVGRHGFPEDVDAVYTLQLKLR